jgi:hypothetical protein
MWIRLAQEVCNIDSILLPPAVGFLLPGFVASFRCLDEIHCDRDVFLQQTGEFVPGRFAVVIS